MRSLLNGIACTGLVLLAAWPARAVEAVEAVWQPQRVVFEYRSEGTTYSCESLKEKIGRVLVELGARDRMEWRRVMCADFGGVARLEVAFESPVPATAENIRLMTDYDSKDRLVARMNGTSLPSPEDVRRFSAAWETVAFRPGRLQLENHDCALLQQVRRQILTRMSVQVLKDIDNVDCSQARPRMKVLALVASPS